MDIVMITCKHCLKILENKNNIFCNNSCSASFNNKNRTHTIYTKNKIRSSLLSIKHSKKSTNNVNIYPKNNYAIIKIIKIILNLDENHIVTFSDFYKTKTIIFNHIYLDNMSAMEINRYYNIGYKNSTLGLHIKNTFDIKLRNNTEASILYRKNNNTLKTVDKEIYIEKCKFKFSPWTEYKIEGYDLLKSYEFCKQQNQDKNKSYIHRDHMISIAYGWENNIPSEHISHPANCQIMLAIDNIKKGIKCSLTYDELLIRIQNW